MGCIFVAAILGIAGFEYPDFGAEQGQYGVALALGQRALEGVHGFSRGDGEGRQAGGSQQQAGEESHQNPATTLEVCSTRGVLAKYWPTMPRQDWKSLTAAEIDGMVLQRFPYDDQHIGVGALDGALQAHRFAALGALEQRYGILHRCFKRGTLAILDFKFRQFVNHRDIPFAK